MITFRPRVRCKLEHQRIECSKEFYIKEVKKIPQNSNEHSYKFTLLINFHLSIKKLKYRNYIEMLFQ